MSKTETLKKIDRALGRFLSKSFELSRENYALWSAGKSKKYKDFEQAFEEAIAENIEKTLADKEIKELFNDLKNKIIIKRDAGEDIFFERIVQRSPSLEESLDFNRIEETYHFFAEKGGQEFLNKAGIDEEFKIKDVRGFVLDKELQEESRLRITELIFQADKTTSKWLAKEMNNGRKEGKSYKRIADEIRKKIPETVKGRAERIARTEMGEMVNASELMTARKNGASTKIWSAAGPNICEICLGNDRAELGMDGMFPSGHVRPPAHPNCKCLLDYKMPPLPLIGSQPWTGGADKEIERNINMELDTLYNRSVAAKKEIDIDADFVAKNVKDAVVIKAPLKNRARAVEKIIKEEGGNVSSLQDVARNTIAVKKKKDVDSVYVALATNPKTVVSRKLDTALGYQGGVVKLKTKVGVVSEIQVATEKMIYAKEKNADKLLSREAYNRIKKEVKVKHGMGHVYYEKWRVAYYVDKDLTLAAEIEKQSSNYYAKFK